MPIEMPKGLPFSVDTWTPSSNRKRHHFLTHAHRDHLAGIAAHSSYPIYSTRLTKVFALRYFPQIEERIFVDIEVGETVVIRDPDGDFSVSAFDANHCPGAVMFLFEGEFGNVLHTGDCRLTPDCLHLLPMKYMAKKGRETLCHLDYLFLDCTFGRSSVKIPSKKSAIQQVINCIWKHPNTPVVNLACDMLGQEEIIVEVSRTFGSKIYVDKTNNSDCFHSLSLIAPEVLSQDPSSRFQVIEGYPRLNERASQKLAEAQANLQPAPLFVRPSAQWYAGNDYSEMTQKEKPGLSEAVRDEFGVWHVCYSMHSSKEELEWALQLLQPKWVISTTPPCRAMELDYVKKHCFKTHITPDDPVWKLLKVGTTKSASLPSSTASEVQEIISATSVRMSAPVESNRLQLNERTMNNVKLKLDLSPPSGTRTVTLFGRARLGLQNTDLFDLLQEKKKSELNGHKSSAVCLQENIAIEEELNLQQRNVAEISVEKLVGEIVVRPTDTDKSEVVSSEENIAIEQATNLRRSSVAEMSVKGDICMGSFDAELDIEKSVEEGNVDIESTKGFKSAESSIGSAEVVDVERDNLCIGSSTSVNVSLRKLYRSMNVPVPRPLPSLVELMGTSKRLRLSSESSSNGLKYF